MCSDKAFVKTKQLRQTYGFDEVAIVPGDVTLNPDQTSTEFSIEDYTFSFPIVTGTILGLWKACLEVSRFSWAQRPRLF